MKREDLNHLLQAAGRSEVLQLSKTVRSGHEVTSLSRPTQQTLMLPVKDQVAEGGTFYAGEILVTQCLVAVDGHKGWGMVMDQDSELAEAVAVLDGAFTGGIELDAIQRLAEDSAAKLEISRQKENEQVSATKVNFDVMVEMTGTI